MTYSRLDEDGYPTGDILQYISKIRSDQSHKEILELVKDLWCYPTYVTVEEDTYTFCTGGWSGNESLISAMQQNLLFWSFCWEMSKKGGVHVFKLKELARST